MKILKKCVVVFFLAYTCAMVAGIVQDHKLFNLSQNDVVLVNKIMDESKVEPEILIENMKKMALNENLCLYNFEIEDNVKTYFMVNRETCTTLYEAVSHHKMNDYDKMNLVDISEVSFKKELIGNVYILNGQHIFAPEILNRYDLGNYGVTFLENESNVALFLQKYIILLIILLIVSVVVIVFDVFESTKRLYYSKIYGVPFVKAILKSALVKSMGQYFIATLFSTILVTYVLRNNVRFFLICMAFIMLFLFVCYIVCMIIFYDNYQKIEYKKSFLVNKKNIFLLGALYTIIIVIFLTSLSEIGQLWMEQKMFLREIERHTNVYTIPNIPTLSFGKREKTLEELQDDADAVSIFEYPSPVEGTYTVNKNYLDVIAHEIIYDSNKAEGKSSFILYPEAQSHVEKYMMSEYQRRNIDTPVMIPYKNDVTIDTFNPLNPQVLHPVLIVEAYMYSSENSYYFISDSPIELLMKIQSIYDKNDIDIEVTLHPFSARFENYLTSIEQTMTNLFVLFSFYMLSSLYFLIVIIVELFEMQKKSIVLQMFYGVPFYKTARRIILTILTAHMIATGVAIFMDVAGIRIILMVSCMFALVDVVLIMSCLLYLTKKNIPLFLKGD